MENYYYLVSPKIMFAKGVFSDLYIMSSLFFFCHFFLLERIIIYIIYLDLDEDIVSHYWPVDPCNIDLGPSSGPKFGENLPSEGDGPLYGANLPYNDLPPSIGGFQQALTVPAVRTRNGAF